jgi:hypothetical protein
LEAGAMTFSSEPRPATTSADGTETTSWSEAG